MIRKYDCHINIEVCASVQAVKYIHIYIYKGHDRATLKIEEEQDEIKQCLDAHYTEALEVVRRLLMIAMHKKDPNVIRLRLHFPGMHCMIFNIPNEPLTILNRGQVQRSRFTEFFRMCATDENAHRLTYREFLQHYV